MYIPPYVTSSLQNISASPLTLLAAVPCVITLCIHFVPPYVLNSLQCDQQQLGNMYAVLSKRRGRVVDEDLVDGTQVAFY